MTYAMVLQNRVIGVLENQETIPEWGPDPAGNPVTAIPCEDTVTLGMIYDPDTGTFFEPEPPAPPPRPEPTQLDRIEAAINDLGAESLPISKVETAIMEGVNGI